jgi:hypothetical protein
MPKKDFREDVPVLVHFAPRGTIDLDVGLLSAGRIIDLCTRDGDLVATRYVGEAGFSDSTAAQLKRTTRYRPGVPRAHCNRELRRADGRVFTLRDNVPLYDGAGLDGLLDDNLTRGDWLEVLNSFFWVFPAGKEPPGFLDHLREAARDGQLCKVCLRSGRDEVYGRVRLSAINGGQLNGAARRGRGTYVSPKAWTRGWGHIAEIGIAGGVSAAECRELLRVGALWIEDA